jgi:hypothetical protein
VNPVYLQSKRANNLFASYVVQDSSLPSGSMFFTIPSSSSKPLSVTPFAAFHCSNSSVLPNFLGPCLQSGYNNFLWSSNIFLNFFDSFIVLLSLCASSNTWPSSSCGSYSAAFSSASSIGSSSKAPASYK